MTRTPASRSPGASRREPGGSDPDRSESRRGGPWTLTASWTAKLRACLGHFATGVAVVSFNGPDGPHAITINSFTSVSLEPPLVLVSVAKTTHSHDVLPEAPFCVNILGAEQEPIARQFSGGPFGMAVSWDTEGVAPRLPGALARVECTPWQHYEAGDHTLYLGEVVDLACRDGDALGYLNSRFTTIAEPMLGLEYII